MAGRAPRVSQELAVHILREAQQGNLPDLAVLSRLHNFQGARQDLLMCTNRNGDTPFLMAARHGHVDLLERLSKEPGVPLEHTNSDGKTALHEAAQNGHIHCVSYLIQAGARVDCLKRADWTPLMLACTKDSTPVVETLVKQGASLQLRNKDGWNAFHIATREGHPDIISYLLDTDSQCWDTKSNNGRTPLHTVALHGRIEAARILMDRCHYDPNVADSCGVTPLMDAVRGDHVTTTEYLLYKYGASLDAEDILGRKAIHHAAQAGALGSLRCIIGAGAAVNQPASVNNITPLHYAAKEGQAAAISLLLQHGADPTACDKRGRTALDVARNARDSKDAVKALASFSTTSINTQPSHS